MSRQKWSRERVIQEILRLHSAGADLTQGRVEAIDSRLVSAAIRYFGSWKSAVEATGLDYSPIAAKGRKRRSEKITRWTREKILEEIRRLAGMGEDLSSAVVRYKHLSLYATARRKEHFGSWASAVEAAGFSYDWVMRASKKRRKAEAEWKRQLLRDYYQEQKNIKGAEPPLNLPPKPSTPNEWIENLLKERLEEAYESSPPEQVQQLTQALQEVLLRIRERQQEEKG